MNSSANLEDTNNLDPLLNGVFSLPHNLLRYISYHANTVVMARWGRCVILLLTSLIVVMSFTSTATAQETYNEDARGIFEMLDRVTTFLLDALLKVGMIVLLAGALIWFTAKNSADRAQTGRWLVGGGIAMMVISLAFTAITALIEWIAIGGG